MEYTPLEFIASIEPDLKEAMSKQAVFSKNLLCLSRVFQFHENAAYLRIQCSSGDNAAPKLFATVTIRAVPGENRTQAIQGECAHVSLTRKIPFFFTTPQDKSCKEFLVQALETLFSEADTLEQEQPELETTA